MNRRNIFAICAAAVLGLGWLTVSAVSQQKSLKDQLVGTWTLVATENVRADGTKFEPYGRNPKGILTFDGSGRYSLTIVRSDLPKMSGKTVDQGTAKEYEAIVKGLVATFGTFSVNESDKTISTHVEGSSFPNITGTDQKRIVVSLNANELRYTNAATITGSRADVTWTRAK
jgi:hypothetical protein